MGLAAWRHCYWIKGSILLVTLGLITAVSTQEIHTRGLARGGILEPAHYHSDTTSASTREEDLAQHVQSDVNATSATAKSAQETPHSVINTAVQSSVVEDTTYQKDTTTKQHWGEKNASISTISGRASRDALNILARLIRVCNGIDERQRHQHLHPPLKLRPT